jgi:hypothetical protein
MNRNSNSKSNFQERIDEIMSRYTLVNQVFVRLEESSKKTKINQLNESFNNIERENMSFRIKKLILISQDGLEIKNIPNKQLYD